MLSTLKIPTAPSKYKNLKSNIAKTKAVKATKMAKVKTAKAKIPKYKSIIKKKIQKVLKGTSIY